MAINEEQAKEKAKGISIRLMAVLGVFAAVVFIFIFIVNEIVLEDGKQFDNEAFSLLNHVKSGTATSVLTVLTFSDQYSFYYLLTLF